MDCSSEIAPPAAKRKTRAEEAEHRRRIVPVIDMRPDSTDPEERRLLDLCKVAIDLHIQEGDAAVARGDADDDAWVALVSKVCHAENDVRGAKPTTPAGARAIAQTLLFVGEVFGYEATDPCALFEYLASPEFAAHFAAAEAGRA